MNRFSLFLAVLLLAACANEPAEKKEKVDITGGVPAKVAKSWYFHHFEVGEGLRREITAMFKNKTSSPDSIQKGIDMAVMTTNAMMADAVYEFRSDNTCTLNIMGQSVNGTYAFADNYTRIVMSQRKGLGTEIDTFSIGQLNDSIFVMNLGRDMGGFHFSSRKK